MNFNFKRIIVASLISAVVIFMFGFVFWTVNPVPEWANKSIPTDKIESVNTAIADLAHGTYVSPGPLDGESPEDFAARCAKGPMFKLSVDPDGMTPGDAKTLCEGFLHAFVAALMVAFLLSMALPALNSFGKRLCFVAMLGIFGSFWDQVGNSIWWFQSCGSTTWMMTYDIVAWILAGVVLAALIKTPAAKPDGG